MLDSNKNIGNIKEEDTDTVVRMAYPSLSSVSVNFEVYKVKLNRDGMANFEESCKLNPDISPTELEGIVQDYNIKKNKENQTHTPKEGSELELKTEAYNKDTMGKESQGLRMLRDPMFYGN